MAIFRDDSDVMASTPYYEAPENELIIEEEGVNSPSDADELGTDDDLYFGDGAGNEYTRTTLIGDDSVRDSETPPEEKEETSTYHSLQYGFILRHTYEHNHRLGEILGVCYNSRYRKFLIIDHKGVTSWMFEARSGQTCSRLLNYPKYKYRLYSNVLYTRKHNVYFALGRDFSLKILNSNFEETYTVDANLRNVMFLLFNQQTDELITGGVGGTKVWSFAQVVETKGWKELRAMANYKLIHKYTLHNVGGGWVKKVELDNVLQHLYCCSETDLYAYDLDGNELFTYPNAHDMSITGCVFSTFAQLLVTSSLDCTVKCWSIQGGLIHTFRGHSKAVTQLLVHPDTSALILSSSLDASVRLWSLHTLECVYSITVSLSGIQWMGLTDDNLLYMCTDRQLTMWNLNHFAHFFGLTRSNAVHISQHLMDKKKPRTLVVSEDSCIRLFTQPKAGSGERVSTILPMPCISPSEKVLGIAYSRELNLVYCLVTNRKLWIYTARTDPACRIAHWNLAKIQGQLLEEQIESNAPRKHRGGHRSGGILPLWLKKLAAVCRALQAIHPGSSVSPCRCISMLTSPVVMWAKDGQCSPRANHFLLLGLEDGRIMFMDPFVRGRRHMDFKANKDPITEIRHDKANSNLITRVNAVGVSTIQIWSLPDLDLLHELQLFMNLAHYCRMESTLFCGYGDGSVSFQMLIPSSEEALRLNHGQIKSEDDLIGANLVQKRYEHASPIAALDCCQSRNIFLSCSGDGIVKIWSADTQAPLSDIIMNGPLSSAGFLNSLGDIILGFQKNLFYVHLRKACPLVAVIGLNGSPSQGSTMSLAESDVYEDVAVRYEGVLSSAGPLTLKTYLKPYDLAFTKEFVEGTTVIKTALPVDDADSSSSDYGSSASAASTQVYMSPFITPGVSTIELAFAQEESDMAANNNFRQIAYDMLDITNPKVAKHYLPMFGQSPGGTPAVSSPSEQSTPSILSEDEETEGVDNESQPAFAPNASAAARTPTSQQPARSASQPIKPASGPVPLTIETGQVKGRGILDGIRITIDATSAPTSVKSRFALEGSMKIDAKPIAKVNPRKQEEKVERQIQVQADESHHDRQYAVDMQARAVRKKKASDTRKRPAAGKMKYFNEEKRGVDEVAAKKEPAETPFFKSNTEAKAQVAVVARPKNELIALVPATNFHSDIKEMPQPVKSQPPKQTATTVSPQRKRTSILHQQVTTRKVTSSDQKLSGGVDTSQASVEPGSQVDFETLTANKVRSRLPPPRERFQKSISSDQVPASPEMVGGELLVGFDADLEGQSGAVRFPQLPDGDSLDVLNRWVMLAGAEESRTSSRLLADQIDPKRRVENGPSLPSRTGANSSRTESQVFMRLSQSQAASRRGRASAGKDASTRPWTSPPEQPGFLPADLLQAFEDALLRFQGDKDVMKLLKFAGITFDDHWHEKIIERHRLLLMQKELRTQSAASSRRLLFEKRAERLRAQLGVSIDEEGARVGGSADAFLRLMMKHSPEHSGSSRGSTPASSQNGYPNSILSSSMANYTHQGHASGGDVIAEGKARRAAESNTEYRYRIRTSVPVRSPSLQGGTRSPAHSSLDAADVKAIDPRNPEALRPHSSKSIPSKCTRYILLKRQQEGSAGAVTATTFEAQLLRQRFPRYADRMLRDRSLKKPGTYLQTQEPTSTTVV